MRKGVAHGCSANLRSDEALRRQDGRRPLRHARRKRRHLRIRRPQRRGQDNGDEDARGSGGADRRRGARVRSLAQGGGDGAPHRRAHRASGAVRLDERLRQPHDEGPRARAGRPEGEVPRTARVRRPRTGGPHEGQAVLPRHEAAPGACARAFGRPRPASARRAAQRPGSRGRPGGAAPHHAAERPTRRHRRGELACARAAGKDGHALRRHPRGTHGTRADRRRRRTGMQRLSAGGDRESETRARGFAGSLPRSALPGHARCLAARVRRRGRGSGGRDPCRAGDRGERPVRAQARSGGVLRGDDGS